MTDTKALWKGEFGRRYAQRNQGKVPANIAMFGRIMAVIDSIHSILELGCGTGQNLEALRMLSPGLLLTGVEINQEAAKQCTTGTIHCKPILEYKGDKHDMVMTKGVLIHQPPDTLPDMYTKIYSHARSYILLAEYYNPTPVEVPYRGIEGALWKRDFAGEMLDRFSDLKLVDYGFVYHRDRHFPQDDVTWFLLEKA